MTGEGGHERGPPLAEARAERFPLIEARSTGRPLAEAMSDLYWRPERGAMNVGQDLGASAERGYERGAPAGKGQDLISWSSSRRSWAHTRRSRPRPTPR